MGDILNSTCCVYFDFLPRINEIKIDLDIPSCMMFLVAQFSNRPVIASDFRRPVAMFFDDSISLNTDSKDVGGTSNLRKRKHHR